MNPTDDDILRELQEYIRDGMISCSQALLTAEKLKIPPRRVGAALDKESVRIVDCQLGCFGRS